MKRENLKKITHKEYQNEVKTTSKAKHLARSHHLHFTWKKYGTGNFCTVKNCFRYKYFSHILNKQEYNL